MSYARPFGQQQAASPWSAGVPPGLQQQPPPPPAQAQAPAPQMFSQPMGPFDLSAAWQVQPQQAQAPPQVAAGQWAQQPMQQMQAPMQFVPNSGPYMQPMQMHHQHQQRGYQQQQQQQRVPHHQRSLSAPRIGGGQNNKRAVNQNNSFGGGYQRQQNNNSINSNNNNNNNQTQRVTRQQGRQVNQKVQFSNNNNNYNNNANNNKGNINNNTKQQNQKQQQQPQQQQQQQQQQQAKGPVKVTKAAKKQALANANRGPVKNTNKANNSNDAGDQGTKAATPAAVGQQEPKPQSKTAERKQLKLQARKNAEALQKGSLPVVKSTKSVGEKQADAKDEPSIDQNQLKCVPAVFGFVCKLCDVFLRDRASRREHVDLEEHMQKFKVFEEEQQKLASLKAEEAKSEVVEDSNQVTSEKPDESTGEEVGLEPTVDADATSKEDAAVVAVE